MIFYSYTDGKLTTVSHFVRNIHLNGLMFLSFYATCKNSQTELLNH